MNQTISGIEYSLPKVLLLQDTGIGVPELAARTCYDSFDSSENGSICQLDKDLNNPLMLPEQIKYSIGQVNDINHSDLLDNLAWTYFHHSILEHSNISYLVRGTSRGVLQEHARHRIQAISVRSTRYTMSNILNAFAVELIYNRSNTSPSDWFVETLLSFDLFVTTDSLYNKLQIADIFNKLKYQYHTVGHDEFMNLSIAKSSLPHLENEMSTDARFLLLQAGKKKRNVGDSFKHIVNDNWKVDMVITFNVRSLKNYFTLRDSGAAYFQIKWLAQAMKEVTPKKYLDLIIKP